jgi:hypothetical protein
VNKQVLHPFVRSSALVVLAALSPYASFGQATIDTQKKALDSIAEFAERMCTSIPFKGDSTTVELSGQAKAELSKLLKKIADAGLGGAVKYQSSEYEGVLQKDLASAIKSSQDCRISIFKELNNKLLPATRAAAPQPQTYPRLSTASCAPHWQECIGFENLTGLWRGKIPRGPLLSVIVDQQDGPDVFASFAIEQQKCQSKLRLVHVNVMFTTSEFFFKPISVTSGCPDIESIVLTPLSTSSWFRMTEPDGTQTTIVVEKKI